VGFVLDKVALVRFLSEFFSVTLLHSQYQAISPVAHRSLYIQQGVYQVYEGVLVSP